MNTHTVCISTTIPRFFAELELGEKRARLKRVNIHWPILTKIGHFDSVVVVVQQLPSAKFMDNNHRKISENCVGILYPRYKEDMLVYIQHHKNLWDKVDRTGNQCILAGKYTDLRKIQLFSLLLQYTILLYLIELRKNFHCLRNHIGIGSWNHSDPFHTWTHIERLKMYL